MLLINPDKCTGCSLCEAFCSFRAERAVGPAKSRISVLRWEEAGVFIPFTCLQCERPVCLEVCPVGAIKRNPVTRAIEVDGQRCLGCKTCVMACPFGGVAFDPDRGTAVKCDLCQGRPECAKICPTGAIRYIRDDLVALGKRREAISRLSGYLKAAMPGAVGSGAGESGAGGAAAAMPGAAGVGPAGAGAAGAGGSPPGAALPGRQD